MSNLALFFQVGSLVSARGREWVVLPGSDESSLHLRPLGGADVVSVNNGTGFVAMTVDIGGDTAADDFVRMVRTDGDWSSTNFSAGQTIVVTGTNAGEYTIRSVSGSTLELQYQAAITAASGVASHGSTNVRISANAARRGLGFVYSISPEAKSSPACVPRAAR